MSQTQTDPLLDSLRNGWDAAPAQPTPPSDPLLESLRSTWNQPVTGEQQGEINMEREFPTAAPAPQAPAPGGFQPQYSPVQQAIMDREQAAREASGVMGPPTWQETREAALGPSDMAIRPTVPLGNWAIRNILRPAAVAGQQGLVSAERHIHQIAAAAGQPGHALALQAEPEGAPLASLLIGNEPTRRGMAERAAAADIPAVAHGVEMIAGMGVGALDPYQLPAMMIGGLAGKQATAALMPAIREFTGNLAARIGTWAAERAGGILGRAAEESGGFGGIAALQHAATIPPERWMADPIGAMQETLQAGAQGAKAGLLLGAAGGAMGGARMEAPEMAYPERIRWLQDRLQEAQNAPGWQAMADATAAAERGKAQGQQAPAPPEPQVAPREVAQAAPPPPASSLQPPTERPATAPTPPQTATTPPPATPAEGAPVAPQSAPVADWSAALSEKEVRLVATDMRVRNRGSKAEVVAAINEKAARLELLALPQQELQARATAAGLDPNLPRPRLVQSLMPRSTPEPPPTAPAGAGDSNVQAQQDRQIDAQNLPTPQGQGRGAPGLQELPGPGPAQGERVQAEPLTPSGYTAIKESRSGPQPIREGGILGGSDRRGGIPHDYAAHPEGQAGIREAESAAPNLQLQPEPPSGGPGGVRGGPLRGQPQTAQQTEAHGGSSLERGEVGAGSAGSAALPPGEASPSRTFTLTPSEQAPGELRTPERIEPRSSRGEIEGAGRTARPEQTRSLTYASSEQKAATIHGNLQPFAREGPGQVPEPEGGGGVLPQAPGRVQEQQPPPGQAPPGQLAEPPPEKSPWAMTQPERLYALASYGEKSRVGLHTPPKELVRLILQHRAGSAKGPQRARALKEASDAFGKEHARALWPVVDAFARTWQKATGKAHDAFFGRFSFRKGGEPERGALLQPPAAPDTPEFKAWFGRSKVTEAQGTPRVVYHGSETPQFTEFSKIGDELNRFVGKSKVAGFFTDSPDVAALYSKAADKGRGGIYPVYLSIKKPLTIGDEVYGRIRIADARKILAALQEAGETRAANFYAEAPTSTYQMLEALKNIKAEPTDILKRAGYDGMIAIDGRSWHQNRNLDDIKTNTYYVAFEPTQIKSIHNRGTFDPKNPNILMQRDAGAARGSYALLDASNVVIRALTDPNASTLPHEVWHAFLDILPEIDPTLAEQAHEALGGEKGKALTVDQKEHWARAGEDYLRDGRAPSPALRATFKKFRAWLLEVYRNIVGSPIQWKLNKKLRAIFDDMLTRGDSEAAPPEGWTGHEETAEAAKAGTTSAAPTPQAPAPTVERATTGVQPDRGGAAADAGRPAADRVAPPGPGREATGGPAAAAGPPTVAERHAGVRPAARGEFGRHHIERRLTEWFERSGLESATRPGVDLSESEAEAASGSVLSTSFAGPLPGEVRQIIEDHPELKPMFRANTPLNLHPGGEDSISAVGGIEEYTRRLLDRTVGKASAALDMARRMGQNDPEASFLAWLHDHAPAGKRETHVLDRPERLPDGATFSINGERFVARKEEGMTLLSGGGITTYAEALEAVPIDPGSLRLTGEAPEGVSGASTPAPSPAKAEARATQEPEYRPPTETASGQASGGQHAATQSERRALASAPESASASSAPPASPRTPSPDSTATAGEPQATPEEPERLASAKNAHTNAQRLARDAYPLDSPQRQSFLDTSKAAIDKGYASREGAMGIADEVNSGRTLPDNAMQVGMAVYRLELENSRDTALGQIGTMKDEAEIRFKSAEIKRIDDDLELLDKALTRGGTELARAMQVRRMVYDAKLTPQRLEAQAKAAKGAPLTDAERTALLDRLTELDANNKALEVQLERSRTIEAEQRLRQHKASKRGTSEQTRHREFEDLLKAAKELLEAGCH